jgi:hypothetical protein
MLADVLVDARIQRLMKLYFLAHKTQAVNITKVCFFFILAVNLSFIYGFQHVYHFSWRARPSLSDLPEVTRGVEGFGAGEGQGRAQERGGQGMAAANVVLYGSL